MRRLAAVSLFALSSLQIAPVSFAAFPTPQIFTGTDWSHLSSIAVTSGGDSVPYVDQGELGMPAPSNNFGQSIATWTDGTASVLAVGAPDDDHGAVYVFRRAQPTLPWHQEARLHQDAAGNYFRLSVAMAADMIVVGAPYAGTGETGGVYTFTHDTATESWSQETTVLSVAGTKGFGDSIALSDDWLVVGSPNSAGNSGLAQMYHRDGSSWTPSSTLFAPDAPSDAFFGFSVAVSETRVLIGAPNDGTIAVGQGSAYVFRYDTDWISDGKLVDNVGKASDNFGHAVALNGENAVVGALYNGGHVANFHYSRPTRDWVQQPGSLQGDGSDGFAYSLAYDGALLAVGGSNAVYLYAGTPAAWTPIAHLKGTSDESGLGFSISVLGDEVYSGADQSNWPTVDVFGNASGTWAMSQTVHGASDADEQFGSVLAVSGNTVVAAAPNAGRSGGAEVFSRDTKGRWTWEADLPMDGQYATNVAIDGDTIIIGAPGETFGSHMSQGAAYVYVRSPTSAGVTWTQQALLVDIAGHAHDDMGAVVSLSGDTVLVGAPGLNHGDGGAYVFVRSGSTWTQQALLIAAEEVGRNNSVGLTGALSGSSAVLGSFDDAAYAFDRTGTKWSEKKRVVPSDVMSGDLFGTAISFSAGRAFIGSPDKDVGSNTKVGCVYVFETRSWSQQATICSPDATSGAEFGESIAADANRLVVGTGDSSTAYAYSRQNGDWTLQAKFADASASYLGYAVGVSNGLLVLGAPYEGDNRGGRAYVFQDDRIFQDDFE